MQALGHYHCTTCRPRLYFPVNMHNTQELKTQIENLASESESLFLGLAATFPIIQREMQHSLEQSHQDKEPLEQLFQTSHQYVQQAIEHFSAMHERDTQLLETLNKGIQGLGGLDNSIAQIKDDSMEMELISLNAMTVALKSGHAGKAFSVITDELQRLSGRTIQLTDQLIENGKYMLSQFQTFREELDGLEKAEEHFFKNLEDKINTQFNNLENMLLEMSKKFKELLLWARSVTEPVGKIMESVQTQDIVQQSLNHVLMALEELEGLENGENTDPLVFRKNLCELSASILADAGQHLQENVDKIKENARLIANVLEEGEKRRNYLIDEYSRKSMENCESCIFSQAAQKLDEVNKDIGAHLKTKQLIARNGERLASTVEALETRFKAFIRIISRFKTINIASRIEVAKQSGLPGMQDTVHEMSRLTEKISEDVQKALDATGQFIGESKLSIVDFNLQAEEEATRTGRIQESFFDIRRELNLLRENILRETQNFNLFTPGFTTEIYRAGEKIKDFEILIDKLVETQTVFSQSAEVHRQKLESKNIDDSLDSIDSERLRSIIQRFTILAHKKAGGQLAEVEVEEGHIHDEVVFF